jgi:hypothetical protein
LLKTKNSTASADVYFYDYKLFFIRGTDHVLVEHKSKDTRGGRFNDHNGLLESGKLLEIREHFSADEIEKINLFGEELGLDFGKMDVLRDQADGLLYVVDVGDTPSNEPIPYVGDKQFQGEHARFLELLGLRLLQFWNRRHERHTLNALARRKHREREAWFGKYPGH